MVEGALKAALEAESKPDTSAALIAPPVADNTAATLHDALAAAGKRSGKIKIVPLTS
jgi:hypothetical protein